MAAQADELTGIALLYGPSAKMVAHYDSPTQPGRRREWIASVTVGSSVRFRLGNETAVLAHARPAMRCRTSTKYLVIAAFRWMFMHYFERCGPNILISGSGNAWSRRHGDALVMDSMATLHGVEAVLAPREGERDSAAEVGLPPGSRLGVLLWTAAAEKETPSARGRTGRHDGEEEEVSLSGLNLFGDDDDDDV